MEVNSFGGELKTYEVEVLPDRLRALGVLVPSVGHQGGPEARRLGLGSDEDAFAVDLDAGAVEGPGQVRQQVDLLGGDRHVDHETVTGVAQDVLDGRPVARRLAAVIRGAGRRRQGGEQQQGDDVLGHEAIYLPFPDQGDATRVTYFSNYSPHNAPPGHASFMAEVTHRGDVPGDRAYVDQLVGHLSRCGLFARDQVVMTDWTQNEFAYIDQRLDFQARIDRVRQWFDTSGYITFGRFGRYEYHNSDQCIGRAMQVHEHIRTLSATGARAPLQLG